MKIRYDLMHDKRAELESNIEVCLMRLGAQESQINEAKKFVFGGSGITMTAPVEELPAMQMLALDSLRNYKKGVSIKPGNILY